MHQAHALFGFYHGAVDVAAKFVVAALAERHIFFDFDFIVSGPCRIRQGRQPVRENCSTAGAKKRTSSQLMIVWQDYKYERFEIASSGSPTSGRVAW